MSTETAFDLAYELCLLSSELDYLENFSPSQEYIKKELVQRFNRERILSFTRLTHQKLNIIGQKLYADPSQQSYCLTLLSCIIDSMKQLHLPTDDMEFLYSYLHQQKPFKLNHELDNLANLLETLSSDPVQALKSHPELRNTNINDEIIPALLTSVYQNLNDIRLELRPKSPELAAVIKKCNDIIISLYESRFGSEFIRRLKYLLQIMDAADPYSPAWEADVLLSQFDKLGEFFELDHLITTQTNNSLFLTDVAQELSRANAFIPYLIEPLTLNPDCIRQRMRQNTPPLSALIDTCSHIIDTMQKLDLDAGELQRLHLLLLEAYETTSPAPERTVPEIILPGTSVTPSTDASATASTNTSATASTNTSVTPSTDISATASTNTSATASTNTNVTPSTDASAAEPADTSGSATMDNTVPSVSELTQLLTELDQLSDKICGFIAFAQPPKTTKKTSIPSPQQTPLAKPKWTLKFLHRQNQLPQQSPSKIDSQTSIEPQQQVLSPDLSRITAQVSDLIWKILLNPDNIRQETRPPLATLIKICDNTIRSLREQNVDTIDLERLRDRLREIHAAEGAPAANASELLQRIYSLAQEKDFQKMPLINRYISRLIEYAVLHPDIMHQKLTPPLTNPIGVCNSIISCLQDMRLNAISMTRFRNLLQELDANENPL